jgi:FKBP-type peptidyl-prolyl cis-trans isomerase
VLKPGKGARPRPGDEVSVHYVGRFTDGRVFDSSQRQASGFTFMLGIGKVIPGWDEGVALMRVGARYRFHIPWKLAYGAEGGQGIPPKADLIFEIELLAIKEGTPLPEFRKGDAGKQKKTGSGLVYEVLKEGTGDSPRKDQGVRLWFAVWSAEGRFSAATGVNQRHLGSLRDQLPLPFLREVAPMMRPGMRLRLEVPADLCFGNRRALPHIEPGAVSVWELEMVSVQDVPKFRKLDAAKTKTTDSGLRYEVIRVGKGTRKPGARNTVEVRYTGWTPEGVMFDSSHARGDTATFGLGGVIPGWTEGLQLMNEGGIYLFWIPSRLAYGDRPRPGGPIKPGMDLIFLVELVRVVK